MCKEDYVYYIHFYVVIKNWQGLKRNILSKILVFKLDFYSKKHLDIQEKKI